LLKKKKKWLTQQIRVCYFCVYIISEIIYSNIEIDRPVKSYQCLQQRDIQDKYKDIDFGSVDFDEPYRRNIGWKEIVLEYGHHKHKNVRKLGSPAIEEPSKKRRRISDVSLEETDGSLIRLSRYLPEDVIKHLSDQKVNLKTDQEFINADYFQSPWMGDDKYDPNCAWIIAFVIKKIMKDENL